MAEPRWEELTLVQRLWVRAELIEVLKDHERTLLDLTSRDGRRNYRARIVALHAALAALPEVPR